MTSLLRLAERSASWPPQQLWVKYQPSEGFFSSGVAASIPFVVMLVFLVGWQLLEEGCARSRSRSTDAAAEAKARQMRHRYRHRSPEAAIVRWSWPAPHQASAHLR
jgi:hypothetical protein